MPLSTVSVGVSIQVAVASGDGGDVALGEWGSPFNPATGVTYDRLAGTTTLPSSCA